MSWEDQIKKQRRRLGSDGPPIRERQKLGQQKRPVLGKQTVKLIFPEDTIKIITDKQLSWEELAEELFRIQEINQEQLNKIKQNPNADQFIKGNLVLS